VSGARKNREWHEEEGDPVVLHKLEEQVVQRLLSKRIWTNTSSSPLACELEQLNVGVVQLAPGDRLISMRRHSVLVGDHF
jgi:hypothetical protein